MELKCKETSSNSISGLAGKHKDPTSQYLTGIVNTEMMHGQRSACHDCNAEWAGVYTGDTLDLHILCVAVDMQH